MEHDERMAAIENEQKAMQLLTDELAKAQDDDVKAEILAAITASGEKLEKMAEGYAEAFDEEHAEAIAKLGPEGSNAETEVVLTNDQRARILEETGVDMPSIRIPDPSGAMTVSMPFASPDDIEAMAMERAQQFNAMVKAHEKAMEAIEEVLAELEEQEDITPEQIAETREQLMAALDKKAG